MGILLRSAGGGTVVGLLGVAIAMLSIGLALVALDQQQDITRAASVAFVSAGVLAAMFLVSWGYLVHSDRKAGRKITAAVVHMKEGLQLRSRLVNKTLTGDVAIQDALDGWARGVQEWLDEEEPDSRAAFDTAPRGITPALSVPGLSGVAVLSIQNIDAWNGALGELVRELRATK